MTHVLAETDTGDAIRLMDTWQDIPHGNLPDDAKGRRKPRDLSTVTTLVMHQTAVRGGFGVTSRQLRPFRDEPDGEQLARVARYRNTPYHGIFSPVSQVSVIQWPAWAYMHHGDRSNRYSLGWAYDGLFPGDELDADGARESVRHLLDYAKIAGCAIRFIEFHSQHARKPRDPGEEIARRVAVPIAREYGLAFRPERVTGDGREVPASWIS